MYQNNCGCQNNGMGFLPEILGAFSSIMGSGGDSGSGAATPGASSGPVTVSPNISTQISPQISPVFQQQFQPSNSAATAGTAQSLPAMPSNIPGAGGGGMLPYGYAPPAVPAVPQVGTDWGRYAPYALGAVAIVAALKIFGKRKGQ